MTKSVFKSFKELLETFESAVQLAHNLVSPNQSDDLIIRTAIIGFSYHSSIDQWNFNDFEFVNRRIDRELPDEELKEYGANSENIKLFYGLCMGYLLGLYRADLLDDCGFHKAEVQISGVIMLHLERLTRSQIDR